MNIGLIILVLLGGATSTIETVSEETIPEPAVLGRSGIFGGGLIVLRRLFKTDV